MRLFALLVAATLSGCDCGARLVSSGCTTQADCPASSDCREGQCVPNSHVAPFDAGCVGPGCGLSCGARSRCGEGASQRCCPRGESCRAGFCVSGCAALACDAGTRCAPELPACVGPVVTHGCEAVPPPGPWELVERWHFRATDKYRHAIATPVVVDVNGDGAADVVGLFCPDEGYAYAGVVRALSGADGSPLWQTAPDFASASGLAVGDRDGQGHLTVFALSGEGSLVALVAGTGVEVWRQPAGSCVSIPQGLGPSWGGLGLADLEGDGVPEVYCGTAVFSAADGARKQDGGQPAGYYGPLSVAFDVYGEGVSRVLDGKLPYLTGFPAVGDLLDFDLRPGQDRHPELVIAGNGKVGVANHRLPGAWLEALLPAWNGIACVTPSSAVEAGGAPAIADFSGTGSPEIAVGGSGCVSVFSLVASDAGTRLNPRWSRPIRDESSGVSGCAAFDFDGDGSADLLHADETALRIFDGPTGVERVHLNHCSATAYELPVVADLDGDGSAEIVVVENTFSGDIVGCDGGVEPGIRVLAEKYGRFANARPVWNQSTYHVTNVCDGEDLVCGGPFAPGNIAGAIPPREPDSWSFLPGSGAARPYNGYRSNIGSRFASADLTLSVLVADEAACPARLTLRARVENTGAHSAAPGVEVAFSVAGATIARARTAKRLSPGAWEIVEASWLPEPSRGWPLQIEASVNADGKTRECAADNNRGPAVIVRCD